MGKKKKSKKYKAITAVVPQLPKAQPGRPTLYSDELATKICGRLMTGEPLYKICADDDMPGAATVYNWLRDKKDFVDMYARARQVQASFWAEQCLELADKASDGDSASAQRLKVDTRKWIASKLYPKVWGDNGTGFDSSKTEGQGDVVGRAWDVLKKFTAGKPGGGGTGGQNEGGT